MEVGLVCDFNRKVAWRSYSGDSYGGTQVMIVKMWQRHGNWLGGDVEGCW